MTRALRMALLGLAMIAAAAVMAEALLQVGSFFMRGREHDPQAGAAVILCIGDSHTYGAPGPEAESYPAVLQAILDERAPGRWAVVNAGVPGTNTAQWRKRLPEMLDRYPPAIVVFWMGVNDLWNSSGMSDQADTWSESLDALASRSRLYRLFRVWAHDRAIDTAALERGKRLDSSVKNPFKDATWTVKHKDGTVETIDNHPIKVEQFDHSRAAERAADDFRAMVGMLRSRGIEVVMITYPLENTFFAPANTAIRRISSEMNVPMVNGTASAERVPEPLRKYEWADHPSSPIYAEIARDVAGLIP